MHKSNKPNAPVAALSSKLQGLKFMRRGPPPSAATHTPSRTDSISATHVKEEPASALRSGEQDSRPLEQSASSGTGPALRADRTEDGNAEHWVLHSHTAYSPSKDESMSREAAAFTELGWNDWLAASGSRTRTSLGKRKADEHDGDEEDPAEDEDRKPNQTSQDNDDDDDDEDEHVAPVAVNGRRSFGAWAPPKHANRKKRRKGENGHEGGSEEDEGTIKIKEPPSTHNRFDAMLARESASSSGLRKGSGGSSGAAAASGKRLGKKTSISTGGTARR
ncbi:hypothetical protein V8E36_004839 [Tilletia maclaganii]